ncbi:hypothetical protein SOVF_093340 [Spinacia oleracea]|nr:hypothetical protein SOVF_093340 [Spinacia oleracea]
MNLSSVCFDHILKIEFDVGSGELKANVEEWICTEALYTSPFLCPMVPPYGAPYDAIYAPGGVYAHPAIPLVILLFQRIEGVNVCLFPCMSKRLDHPVTSRIKDGSILFILILSSILGLTQKR